MTGEKDPGIRDEMPSKEFLQSGHHPDQSSATSARHRKGGQSTARQAKCEVNLF